MRIASHKHRFGDSHREYAGDRIRYESHFFSHLEERYVVDVGAIQENAALVRLEQLVYTLDQSCFAYSVGTDDAGKIGLLKLQ